MQQKLFLKDIAKREIIYSSLPLQKKKIKENLKISFHDQNNNSIKILSVAPENSSIKSTSVICTPTMSTPTDEIKTFNYTRNDLKTTIPAWANGVSLSVFDYLLHQSWDNKMRQPDNGPFLYPLDSIIKLMSPGKVKYQGVFCPSRSVEKRPPPEKQIEEKTQTENSGEKKESKGPEDAGPKVLTPFNPKAFHFGKIPKNEYLFKIQHIKIGVTSEILLNNAPYERCHSLLITEMDKNKPQIVTYEGLVAALEVALLSTHPGMRILYNGMGACGSVNQQHFQIYYTSTYQLPIDVVELKPMLVSKDTFINPLFKTKDTKSTTEQQSENSENKDTKNNHPGLDLPAYVINGVDSSNLTQFATQISTFTEFLVNENIPHNLCICRDHITGQIKIFIWVRKFQTNRDYKAFNVASTELIGHCYYGDRALFDKHSESDIRQAMYDMRLDDERQLKVDKYISTIFDPSSRGLFSAIFGWF